MTSIIRWTGLGGGGGGGWHGYLLEVDDFALLLDCGWRDTFDPSDLKEVVAVVGRVGAVLLSHPDIPHLGALPYLVGKCGLQAPIYATVPVYKMGQMFMYDAFESKKKDEDFTLWDLDDVDSAFDKVTQLKYSQRIRLVNAAGREVGLEITAYLPPLMPSPRHSHRALAQVSRWAHARGYRVEDCEGDRRDNLCR
jgi:cleavage and polyadenylation specificity factor subunit 2